MGFARLESWGDGPPEETSKGQLEADLREWWRATDVDTRQRYLVVDETNAAMHKAIVQARRFAVDSSLEAWVDVQKVQKGINPAPGMAMQLAVAVKRRIGVEHPANRRSSWRWLQRRRCRCGIQLRRGNVRERLSVDQMHGKVIHGAARRSSRGVGWFWVGGVEVEKNDDRVPVAKSRPPLSVVIKTGPRT